MSNISYCEKTTEETTSYWTAIDNKIYTLTFDIDNNISTIIDGTYINYKHITPNQMIYIVEDVVYTVIAPPILIKKYILSLLPRVDKRFEQYINDNKLQHKGYILFRD